MMRYEKYKPSEILWLREIPAHWNIKRTKNVLSNKKYPLKTGPFGTQLRGNDLKDEGNTCVYSQRNVIDNQFDEFKYFVDDEKAKELANFYVSPNDILITTRGTIGRASKVPENALKGILHPCLITLRTNPKIINATWLLYYLNDSGIFQTYISAESGATTIEVIYSNTLSNFIQILPPLEEQSAIVKYLDTKTQAIYKKIDLLTQKADYYKELRKSIINDAVCKGLNKNVNLKESEFIFPVNTNWKRYRLKDLGFLYSGLSGKAGDDFNQDDNPNNKGFIPFTNIANNTYLKANHLGKVALGENEKQNKVRKGDLFFLMSSEGYEDVGKTAALAEDINNTYLNSFCKGYRITKKFCEPYFLNYLLLSDNYRKSLIIEGKGFTRINLKMEKVTDFFVYLPSTKEEQAAITNYLDEKTQKIDAIVSNIGKQIEMLKALRKTLINDVVTGKIKVVNN